MIFLGVGALVSNKTELFMKVIGAFQLEAELRLNKWNSTIINLFWDHYETRTREVARERLSHYEYSTTLIDMGNGYFEEETISTPVYETYYETEEYQEPIYRDEPVYAMKYYYDIDRYVYERSVNTSGNDKEPYWGEVKLNYDERVSKRNEEYKISGISDEKEKRTLEISVNFEKWNALENGQTVKVKIYKTGTATLVD